MTGHDYATAFATAAFIFSALANGANLFHSRIYWQEARLWDRVRRKIS